MKKIICAVLCLLALTACKSADNTPAEQAQSETEISAETNAGQVQNVIGENAPPAEQKGDVIRVTAVDGDVITGEKMPAGKGFGGGRPEGEPPTKPESGSMPEGESPVPPIEENFPRGENMPEKGERPEGDRPAGEVVTFTITDSTAMDMESIFEGDMIIAELNSDGTAISVKKAAFDKQPRKTETT